MSGTRPGHDASAQDGAEHDAPDHDAPEHDGAGHGATDHDAPERVGAKDDETNHGAPRRYGAEHDGSGRDGVPATDDVDTLVIAGWTGRDARAVEHHVRELKTLGVTPPSVIPLFYRASAALLGPHRAIEVVGEETSGEVEPLIVQAGGRRWLGVASDHTDRALEAHSVALSKQICAKPCAPALWVLDEVLGRLDALELRAWIADAATLAADPDGDAGWTLYQEGTLAAIRPLEELLDASPLASSGTAADGDGTRAAMLCGTLPAIGGVRPAGAFRMELRDPETGRTLRHAYAVRPLPVIG